MAVAMAGAMREWLDQLEDRTKAFAVASVRLAKQLHSTSLPRSVIWQFVDASTAVGANHRASRHARSDKELISKLSVVLEEADETLFWLELIAEVETPAPTGLTSLATEATELRAIFSRSVATMRERVRTD
jgi:four helix bundle protein